MSEVVSMKWNMLKCRIFVRMIDICFWRDKSVVWNNIDFLGILFLVDSNKRINMY